MRVFNQDKTVELDINELDYEKGKLEYDKLFVQHHEATNGKEGKSVEQVAAELQMQGKIVKQYESQPGKYYVVDRVYLNGEMIENPTLEQVKSASGEEVTEILSMTSEEPKEAYDEYEDIQVYIPYTKEELQSIANEKRHTELKAELAKIMEDIQQEQLGLIRSDYADKRARAAEIINELRVLEGKEPREIKEVS